MKKAFCLLALTLFICGCTSNQANVDINTKVIMQTPSPETLSSNDTVAKIWDNFAETASLNEAPNEPNFIFILYRRLEE